MLDHAGRESVSGPMAAEVIAAEGALQEMKRLRRAAWGDVPSEMLPIGTAVRGLRMAIPISLAFWIVAAMLLWVLRG